MKIIVTGGAGFIGSHLVERLLADGHSVTVIDDFNDFYNPEVKRANVDAFNGRVPIFETDIRDKEGVKKAFASDSFDTVIHMAARAGVRPSINAPELYISTNINGTFNILEAARTSGVKRFVLASSSSVYGLNKKIPFSESDRIEQTISPYAATKLAAEQLCSNYAHLYGIQTVCLRFFTVYGPRQRPDLAISRFTRLIHGDQPIQRYGDGTSGRDYTYVEDIVQGVVAALHYNKEPFDIFNLGGSHTVTLNELIAEVENALGKKATIEVKPDQPGDVPVTSADVTKAGEHLGYHPETSLHEGVRKYVEWFLEKKRRSLPSNVPASSSPVSSVDLGPNRLIGS